MFADVHNLALGILVPVAMLALSVSLYIARARRSHRLWSPLLAVNGPLIGLAGIVALVFAPNLAAMRDLTQLAHLRGIVTDRNLNVIESPSTGGSDNVPIYPITVGRRTFHVTADAFGNATVGSCVVVTYGPASGYVFDVHGCAAR